jgi:hypothetical protein
MRGVTRVLLFGGALLFAGPAMAQYYQQQYPPPPPPPPQYYPPPPPPQYYPPPRYYPPPPPELTKPEITIRVSGGVAFVGAGYYCGYYYYYYPLYSCGVGYSAAFPDVNLDLDIWVKRNLGISVGANVMWGTYTPYNPGNGIPTSSIYSTIWEPHVDFLFAPPDSPQVKGRVRLGFGLYIADVNNGIPGGNITPYTYNSLGGAFRLGFGASFLPKSKVGIGIDAIFEAGWIGSNYVSTIQLLIGPEIHF